MCLFQSEGLLKLNYDSVDLAEVEFADDNSSYQEFNPEILKLREAMVYNLEDKMLDVEIKFHYDNMRRVGTEKRDYYISPFPDTSFSIGLAIPSKYGDYQIGVGDEVQKSFHQGIPLERYFKDENGKDKEWKIHPEW